MICSIIGVSESSRQKSREGTLSEKPFSFALDYLESRHPIYRYLFFLLAKQHVAWRNSSPPAIFRVQRKIIFLQILFSRIAQFRRRAVNRFRRPFQLHKRTDRGFIDLN